jgi:hypothetical protein
MRIGFARTCRWCDSPGPFRVRKMGLLKKSYVCEECNRRFMGLTLFGIRIGWQADDW